MSDIPPYVPRLVHLPGTELTPEVVLYRTVDKLPRIRAVMVIIQWDDKSYSIDASSMTPSEICMTAAVAQADAQDIVFRSIYRGGKP